MPTAIEKTIKSNAEHSSLGEQAMIQQVLPLAFVHGQALVESPKDLYIPINALEVSIDDFEGPLDLLLYLIKKQKFDILDLPIAQVSEQYIQYIHSLGENNIELASEYLVMAATLAEIKSRLLLPKQVSDEEESDPRAELVKRLQQYQVFKEAAVQLEQLPRQDRELLIAYAQLETLSLTKSDTQVSLNDLVKAFQQITKRHQAFEHHHISREVLSTRERMSQIIEQLSALDDLQSEGFNQLFSINEGKQGVVVTFLAILELMKEQMISCFQSPQDNHIYVMLNKNSAQ